jgi:ATP-binding cassette subfamily F protein 3
VLSGGERSRVLLGKLLIAPSNILFLDEPTHHLDIESCQAMMDAVRDFEGAALVVAHDEHFLNEVATKLIVFKNDRVFLYPGNYKEFLESVGWEEDGGNKPLPQIPAPKMPEAYAPAAGADAQMEARDEVAKEEEAAAGEQAEADAPSAAADHKSKGQAGKMKRKARAEFVAKRAGELKPLEAKIKSLENEIISSEAKVKEMNIELSKPGLGAIRRSQLSRELKAFLDSIDSLYNELDRTMKEYDAAKIKYSGEGE